MRTLLLLPFFHYLSGLFVLSIGWFILPDRPVSSLFPAASRPWMALDLKDVIFGLLGISAVFGLIQIDRRRERASEARCQALLEETRGRIEGMARLNRLGETLNRPMSIEEAAEAIGQGAMRLVNADRAVLFLYGGGTEIVCGWSHGLSDAFLVGTSPHILGHFQRPHSREIRARLFDDLELVTGELPYRELSHQEGFRAIGVTQLLLEDRPLAALACIFNQPHAWSDTEREVLEAFSRQAAIALENVRLYDDLQTSYLQSVLALAKSMDARDTYTADHSQRLANWAYQIARRMGCTDVELQEIHWATLLHDIGKLGVPDAILSKPGPLDEKEWEIMKRHPETGASIVGKVKKLAGVAPIVRAHHEKFDGTGYPDGRRGEQIPKGARILKVADAYGAITDQRAYRAARSHAEALEEIHHCSGTDFDPRVVEVFLSMFKPTARLVKPASMPESVPLEA